MIILLIKKAPGLGLIQFLELEFITLLEFVDLITKCHSLSLTKATINVC